MRCCQQKKKSNHPVNNYNISSNIEEGHINKLFHITPKPLKLINSNHENTIKKELSSLKILQLKMKNVDSKAIVKTVIKSSLNNLTSSINPNLYSITKLQFELNIQRNQFKTEVMDLVCELNKFKDIKSLVTFFKELGCTKEDADRYANSWEDKLGSSINKAIAFAIIDKFYIKTRNKPCEYYDFIVNCENKLNNLYNTSSNALYSLLVSGGIPNDIAQQYAKNWATLSEEDKYLFYQSYDSMLYATMNRPEDFTEKALKFLGNRSTYKDSYSLKFANCLEYAIFMKLKITNNITWINKKFGKEINIHPFYIQTQDNGDHIFNGIKLIDSDVFYLFDGWSQEGKKQKLIEISTDHPLYDKLNNFYSKSVNNSLKAKPQQNPSEVINQIMEYKSDNHFIKKNTRWKISENTLAGEDSLELQKTLNQDDTLIKLKSVFMYGTKEEITSAIKEFSNLNVDISLEHKLHKTKELINLFNRLETISSSIKEISDISSELHQIEKDLYRLLKHPDKYHGLLKIMLDISEKLI